MTVVPGMPEPGRAAVAAAVIGYVAGVLALGALSAPWAYLAFEAVSSAGAPFEKFTLRWTQLMALLGLWPLLRFCRLGLREGLGFARRPAGSDGAGASRTRQLGAGVIWGAGALLCVALGLLVTGVREFRPEALDLGFVGVAVAKAALTATAVAFIEEIWFRGGLYSACRKAGSWLMAAAVTSAIYASLHFVRADVAVDPSASGWTAGFEALAGALQRWSSPGPALWADFTALLLAGFWAACARHFGGTIWLCIGLHAGWVLVIQVLRRLTVVQPDSTWRYLAGDFDRIIGWGAAVVFVVFIALSYRRWRTSPGPA